MIKKLHLISITILLCLNLHAQDEWPKYFNFKIDSKSQLDSITQHITIDNVNNLTVTAYADCMQWDKFISWQIPYSLIQPSKSKVINMASTVSEMSSWDRYPSYEVYIEMMQNFAASYPDICQLEEIGTLNSGRKLLAVKISDNVSSNNEAEPELFYTSSMHGDELTGAILMLRLIDYLLTNYNNTDLPNISKLINGAEIWINPLANPNGTYYGGNSTVASARRTNDNAVDLNRNFPDPGGSDHPDGYSWQEETVLMMDFASSHHFSLSGNFHGGYEVVNYPWDTWSRLAADDSWWQLVAREYADSLQLNGPAGYFDDENNGITNGYAWYTVNGSRQDYINFFHNCREATFEISTVKLVSSDNLPSYWGYNKGGLIAYLLQGLNGLHGTITNPLSEVLEAKVVIEGHDIDSSWVKTDIRAGDYYRYLKAGSYNLTFSSQGFDDKTINDVVIIDGQATELNVLFGEAIPILTLNWNTLDTTLAWNSAYKDTLKLTNSGFADLNYSLNIENSQSKPWININEVANSLPPYQTHEIPFEITTSDLIEGSYSCNLILSGDSSLSIPISVRVNADPALKLSITNIDTNLLVNQYWLDTIVLTNSGYADLNYSIEIQDSTLMPWFSINKNLGMVSPTVSDSVIISFDCTKSGTGIFQTNLKIDGDIQQSIPVNIRVDTLPYFFIPQDSLYLESVINDTSSIEFTISNPGGDNMPFTSLIKYDMVTDWLNLKAHDTIIEKQGSVNFTLTANSTTLNKGFYTSTLWFYSIYDTAKLSVNLRVDTLPHLHINTSNFYIEAFKGTYIIDTVLLTNTGDGKINISPTIVYNDTLNNNWITAITSNTSLLKGDTLEWSFICDSRNILPGTHNAQIQFGKKPSDTINIEFTVYNVPILSVNRNYIYQQVNRGSSTKDTILLSNLGNGILPYSISLEKEDSLNWLKYNSLDGEIEADETDTLLIDLNTLNLAAGDYSNKIIITTNKETRIPVTMKVLQPPLLTIDTNQLTFSIPPSGQDTKTIRLTNTGGEQLIYEIRFKEETHWLFLNSENIGALYNDESIDLEFTADASNIASAEKKFADILIKSNDIDTTITAELNILVGIENTIPLNTFSVYPNPFSKEVHLSFQECINNSELAIYNTMGQKIKQISSAHITSNTTTFKWNGNNTNNIAVPAGLYIFRVQIRDQIITGLIQKL